MEDKEIHMLCSKTEQTQKYYSYTRVASRKYKEQNQKKDVNQL